LIDEKLSKERDNKVPHPFSRSKRETNKKTNNKWIFFKFQGISELITQKKGKTKSEILNMDEIHWKILSFMGEEYENISL
jgi:transposase